MKRSDLLFFGSGAAALVYQTVWARLLARLLGSGSSGTALVLGIFMGGMAIGALLGGRLSRRTARPVRLFVMIELALAVWAALSPTLLTMIEPVGGILPRAAVATLALLGPTVLMGMTFPLMGRLVISDHGEVAKGTAGFYGANTLGAAAGALVGPFLLMPWLGLHGALYAAALLELAVALGAGVVFSGQADGSELPPHPESFDSPAAHSLLRESLLWAAFLMGASALALEVILTRVLIHVTGASIYAFAIVLTVFLLGIGLGSRWLDVEGAHGAEDAEAARARLQQAFVTAALWIPVASLGGLYLLRLRLGEADLFQGLSNRMPGGMSVRALWLGHATWAALALLGPAVAFGRALPSVIGALALARPESERERVLGIVYGANTAGCLVGALGAGFVLLPSVGPRWALLLALLAPLAAAFLSLRQSGHKVKLVPHGALLGGALLAAFLVLVPAKGDAFRLTLAHGPHATVSVFESESSGEKVRALQVNGKVVATSGAVDRRLQRLLAAIPAQLHGELKSAVVIGMGTGMTAGALLALPSLERLDVVEISSVMPEAGARPFTQWNRGLLDDPRTTVIHGDGRHELARTSERYDLVTSDPIHPWTAGSSDLYCVEHFVNMREHMAPGGIASQWLPLYQLSEEDVRTVMASWAAAFPETSAWLTAYDLVLVGSDGALPGPQEIVDRPLPPEMARDLEEAGVRSSADLGSLFAADDKALRAYAAGTPPMYDNRPVLEFRAPRSFLAGYSTEALRWAARDAVLGQLPEPSRARARRSRELLDTFLKELPSGWSQAAARYGKALLL